MSKTAEQPKTDEVGGFMSKDLELKLMNDISKGMARLTSSERDRVVMWVSAKYGIAAPEPTDAG